jgi:regulator of RNase E activity RraA
VLIPQDLVAEVVAAAVEQEQLEGWIMSQVEAGMALPGLYPPNAEQQTRYQAWAASRRRDPD